VFLFEPAETPYDLRFRLFDIPVRINIWFWAISVLLCWSWVRLGFQYLLIAVLCVFASILIHELGHIVMGRLFGARGYIVLYSFGGLAVGSNDVRYRWQRIAVSLAGPAAQFVLYALIEYVLLRQTAVVEAIRRNLLLGAAVVVMRNINWYWPILNLLPIWPLDGGQVSREVLSGFSPRHGLRWSLGLSVFCAGLLTADALMTLLRKEPLIPFLGGGGFWTLLLFGSLAFSSYQLLQQVHVLEYHDDRGRGGRWGDDEREPWEQDPDFWKR
jgi:Zn-dependent protease